LRERAPADLLLVLLGDHQPPASVAGEGVRWDVPVHVIANRPDLLARLVDAGFEPGLEPAGEPIGDMYTLTPLIFGGPASTVDADSARARLAR
jgi:hypothetical protein